MAGDARLAKEAAAIILRPRRGEIGACSRTLLYRGIFVVLHIPGTTIFHLFASITATVQL